MRWNSKNVVDKDVGKWEYWGTCKGMEDWKLYFAMALTIVLHEKRLRDSVEHDK